MAEGQGLGDNHTYGEDDSDQDPRVARVAVQQQMRQVENNVDRITRELDLLNTDLEGIDTPHRCILFSVHSVNTSYQYTLFRYIQRMHSVNIFSYPLSTHPPIHPLIHPPTQSQHIFQTLPLASEGQVGVTPQGHPPTPPPC